MNNRTEEQERVMGIRVVVHPALPMEERQPKLLEIGTQADYMVDARQVLGQRIVKNRFGGSYPYVVSIYVGPGDREIQVGVFNNVKLPVELQTRVDRIVQIWMKQ